MELVPCPVAFRAAPYFLSPGYPIALFEPTPTYMERPSFEQIFAEYAPRVRAYFLRHGLSRSLADEVAQEVMISVWSNTERFDPEKGAMSTWVFAIARNRLIDSVRRLRRPEPDPDDPCWVGDRQSQEPSPERAVVEHARARALRSALERLPPEQRRVLEALYFDGQSMSELSTSTGIPLGTIKTRARLALRALRQTVGAEGDE
jgi:RNA polymerase sigma-70 factor (ECF subfamily)